MNPDDLQDDEDRFASLLSMLTGRVPDAPEQDEPDPLDAAPSSDLMNEDEVFGPAPTQAAPAAPAAPVAPPARPVAAPDWARGLSPATTPDALTRAGTAPLRAAGDVVQQTATDAGQRAFDDDIRKMKKREADAGSTPRERVRRMFLGGLLGGLGSSPDQIQGVLGPNGATRQAAIREQMSQMVAQRREQQQERRTALLAQLDRQRRGETEDRRLGLEQQQVAFNQDRARGQDQLARDRLAQDEAQFRSREAQDMKERTLSLEGADRRSSRHANAMVGRDPNSGVGSAPGGGVPIAPGAPEASELTPDQMSAQLDSWANQDALVVRETGEYLRRRGEDVSSPEGIRAHYQQVYQAMRLPPRRREQYLDNIRASEGAGRSGSSVDARAEELELQHTNRDAEIAVPGWAANGAYRLRPQEATDLRQVNASFASARAAIGRIMQLRTQMGWADFVRGAANAGTAEGQEMLRLSRQVQTYLRQADHMGVPTGNEQVEARQQSPEAYSVQNLLTNEESFRGLMRALAIQHVSFMGAYGLTSDLGGSR
jgi:hypothetical protein